MLYENPTTHDIELLSGSLRTIDAPATETGQRIVSRLKTVKGEWFLDTEFGLDYRNAIWKKQVSIQARDTHIQKQMLLSAGQGAKINSYTAVLDTAQRTLTVNADVQDATGTTTNVSLEV